MNQTISEHAVKIGALAADLAIPGRASGVVLFAHGSGSSRHSSRNRVVAAELQQTNLATLLIDLLTEQEEEVDLRTAHLRFDIPLLAERVVEAAAWIEQCHETSGLPIGCFGASTGAGAAFVAAARIPESIHAVVSRGGRPDLAGDALRHVKAPTLLIVGGHDYQVIELNQRALDQIRAPKNMEIVPKAGHLFEEPGALEEVSRLAVSWFGEHLN